MSGSNPIGPVETHIAFRHLRALYIELHDRLPSLDEVRGMFAFARPDLTREEIDGICKAYTARYS